MNGKPRGKWSRYCVVGALVLVGGFVWGGITYRAVRQEFACKIRLIRVFYPSVRKNESLITTEELKSTLEETGEGSLTCPRCGLAYVYKPVADTLYTWRDRARLRMIAWCATHCHKGQRNVLLESGAAFTIPEAAFQKAILAEFTLSSDDIIAASRKFQTVEADPDNAVAISEIDQTLNFLSATATVTYPYLAPPERYGAIMANYLRVEIGTSMKGVEALLGKPDEITPPSQQRERKYGGIETVYVYILERQHANAAPAEGREIAIRFDGKQQVTEIIPVGLDDDND